MLRRKKSKKDVVLDRASDLAENAQGRVRDDIVPAVASAFEALGDSDHLPKSKKKKKKEKKKSKLKKLVILAGLGGIVFFVVKKLQGPSDSAQSGPPPAPVRPAPTPAPPGDNVAATPAAADDSDITRTGKIDPIEPSGS